MQVESSVRPGVASSSDLPVRLDGWSTNVAQSLDHWAQGALNIPLPASGGPGVENAHSVIAAAATAVSSALKLFRL